MLPAFSDHGLASRHSRGGDPLIRLVPRDFPVPVLSQQTPKWIDPTLARLESLTQLSAGWDSYGSHPVDSSRVQQVYDLLQSTMDDDTPAPTLVPTPDGGIQMEWHTLGVELEIGLLCDAELEVSFEDLHGTEEPFDGVLSYDVTRLRQFMQLLASRARSNMRDAVRNG